MDVGFLQRANEIEFKLEAKGLFLAAEAMRELIQLYFCEHSNGLDQSQNLEKPDARVKLVRR